MNYELCKELKDAGFPQQETGNGGYLVGDLSFEGVHLRPDNIAEMPQEAFVYMPSLSELIAACGKDFKTLTRLREPDEEGSFWAESDNHVRCGETAEEAVAHLWLALNPPQHG